MDWIQMNGRRKIFQETEGAKEQEGRKVQDMFS